MLKPLKVKDAIAKMRRNPNFVHLDKVDWPHVQTPHKHLYKHMRAHTHTHTQSQDLNQTRHSWVWRHDLIIQVGSFIHTHS